MAAIFPAASVAADAQTTDRLPTIAIMGLGYVGLPTAIALATAGVPVRGIDISDQRLDAIRSRRVDLIPADADRLAVLLADERELLTLHDEPDVIAGCDAVMICVPTPIDRYLAPDLRALKGACDAVVAAARPGQTIIVTSTTYVGSTREMVAEPLRRRGLVPGVDVAVAFSPERIDPGNEVFPQDTVPRVVGGYTVECGEKAADIVGLVAPRVHMVTSADSAEFVKLYENSFRAVNIAFANEMADVARGLGVDIIEAIDAAASKPYGFMRFTPGPGVGGHCIPCDPHYLLWQLRARRQRPGLLDEAMDKIAGRPAQVVDRALQLLADVGTPMAGARVLVVGVAYKPGVQDMRESPALEIVADLAARRAEVAYSDPYCPEITVEGRHLKSVVEPGAHRWDLVIVNTMHPLVDHSWLAGAPLVLDASFRVPASLSRMVL